METIIVLNPEGVTEEELNTYEVRESARAVLLDDQGRMALLKVGNKSYHKLPGGGLDGDDMLVGLSRECLEEVGCDITVTAKLGMVVEYRKIFGLKQISYCFLGNVKGPIAAPNFTESELANGFSLLWVPVTEAVALLEADKPTNREGALYIGPRDRAILATALKHL